MSLRILFVDSTSLVDDSARKLSPHNLILDDLNYIARFDAIQSDIVIFIIPEYNLYQTIWAKKIKDRYSGNLSEINDIIVRLNEQY